MSENEVTKILKKSNASIKVSIYTKPNIINFYIAKEFTKFINEQNSKWEAEKSNNSQWNQVLLEFKSLKNAWEAILTMEKVDENILRTKMEAINKLTLEKPLFIYNAKAVAYLNNLSKQVENWSDQIIRQFIQPDSINIFRQDFRITIYYYNILNIVKNEDNEINETIQLN
ncbi:MAG: hypothetical protein WC679_13905, partial [Bacteroidales bacterium]